jgi:hypothetical protein
LFAAITRVVLARRSATRAWLVLGQHARRERTIGNFTWRGEHWPPDADETERLRADLGQRAAQDQRRHDFPLLVDGLRRLCAMFEPEVLCTGHGPVLRGDIRAFLQKLVEVARV